MARFSERDSLSVSLKSGLPLLFLPACSYCRCFFIAVVQYPWAVVCHFIHALGCLLLKGRHLPGQLRRLPE